MNPKTDSRELRSIMVVMMKVAVVGPKPVEFQIFLLGQFFRVVASSSTEPRDHGGDCGGDRGGRGRGRDHKSDEREVRRPLREPEMYRIQIDGDELGLQNSDWIQNQ